MLAFWAVVAVFIIITFAFLLPPLFRTQDTSEVVALGDLTVSVYQDQFDELDNDLKNQIISQEQYDLAKIDLEKNLLGDMEKAGQPDDLTKTPVSSLSNKITAGLIIVAIPIASVVLYNTWGGGVAALDPDSVPLEVQNGQHEDDIEGMLNTLITRLEEDPSDGEGWYMLGRTYQFLKRYPEAVTAFERSLPLGGNQSADLLANYADSIAMASNRVLTDKAIAALEQALTVDSEHVKSLWLLGTSAYQEQRYPKALEYWERLMRVLPPDSQEANTISANIGEVRSIMGLPAVTSVEAAESLMNDVRIQGTVSLADEIAAKASPEDTVFVFARAANGSRMPLAIVRKQVKDLPFDFTLDDSMAMSAATKLSSVSQVIVSVRVSKTGNAMPQPGDLEGMSDVLDVAHSEPLSLLVDRIIE